MITTMEYLLEPFLTQYYLQEAICSDFTDAEERRRLFEELARVFCLPLTEELEEYYRGSCEAPFDAIRDIQSYERLCRTIEFAERSGQPIDLCPVDHMILAQKREAMLIKSELFKQGKHLTKDTLAEVLLTMAMNGNIPAMSTLGYMEYHGMCLCRDTHNALKRIRLCANWNDLFGNLMGIAYDTDNAQKYYDNLYTMLSGASQKQVFSYICSTAGNTAVSRVNPVAKIIERAFGLGIVCRSAYDQVFARVAFSEIISVEDKEKLLLSKKKDAIVSLSGIPFDLDQGRKAEFDRDCIENVPLQREGELRRIMQNLTVSLSCPPEVYKPLLIVAEDAYINAIYCRMLKEGFGEDTVAEIDSSTLTAQDFAPSDDNVFLRGLSDTKAARTVFLLKNCEELDSERLGELHKMLDYTYRRRFKLFDPPVALDLSRLMFVMLSGARNAATAVLSKCCDTVWAERVSSKEKLAVIDSMFSECASSFGCAHITLGEGGRQFLAGYATEQIHRIIDRALRNAVYENADRVTSAMLDASSKEQHISGGTHGFGYIGGGYDA